MIIISGCKDTKDPGNTHYQNYRKNECFSGKLILEISLLPYPYPSESQPCYPAPILSDEPFLLLMGQPALKL